MTQATFITHLAELRKSLIKCIITLIAIMFILLPFSQVVFHTLALPLLKQLPSGQKLIATAIISPIFIPIKLTMIASVFIAMPYFIYQAWMFIASGLYNHEKRILWIMMILSSLLFYCGIIFVYFVIFPILFKFFLTVAPESVTAMPDISQYLDFCLKLMLAFGLTFEIPVIVTLLIYFGITSEKSLRDARPYVIVGAFILAMFLTPPDVLSQILLAIPMCLLFELGILLGRYLGRRPSLNTAS